VIVGNACGLDTSDNLAILVNSNPIVTLSPFSDVCIENGAFPLTGGLPVGGIYSGTGVNSGLFDPATAGTGTHTITYSYTDSNSCTNNESQNINVNTCTGIENIIFINYFEIYPNPNTSEFTIEINITQTENLDLKITNSLGQEIFTEKFTQFKGNFEKQLDLSEYPVGIYNIQLMTEKGVITRQIIIE